MKKRVLSILAVVAGLCFPAQAEDYFRIDNLTALTPVSFTNAAGTAGFPGSGDVAVWNGLLSNASRAAAPLTNNASWQGIRVGSSVSRAVIIGTNGVTQTVLTLGSAGIDMSAAAQNLTITPDVVLGAVQDWNVGNSRTLVVNGLVSGTSVLTKSGVGTLTLNNSNSTFSGGLTLSGGTLSAGGNDVLGTGTVTIQNGATLAGNGKSQANNFVIGSGGANIDGNGTLSGSFSGSGDLTHGGSTTAFKLNLLGDNSGFSGTVYNNAIITVGTKDSLGSGTLVMADDTSLGANNALTGVNAIANDIVLNGNAKFGASLSTQNFELTGLISGSGSLQANHALVTTTLSHANTYTGGTTVSLGAIIGNADGCFGTGGMNVADGAALILQSANTMDDLASIILGTTASLAMDFTGSDTVLSISLDGGATTLAAGTYDAAALALLNGSGTYTGIGSLTVIPEPATVGMLGLGALITMAIRRMRTR